MSRPTRARGLKLPGSGWLQARRLVAPHAGAWIETYRHTLQDGTNWVAPHAGAWIETKTDLELIGKHLVAPHAGAWIETLLASNISRGERSRPTRARGLKRHVLWSQNG